MLVILQATEQKFSRSGMNPNPSWAMLESMSVNYIAFSIVYIIIRLETVGPWISSAYQVNFNLHFAT